MSIDLANLAWDDGELVRAYDAAMDEFHVRLKKAVLNVDPPSWTGNLARQGDCSPGQGAAIARGTRV